MNALDGPDARSGSAALLDPERGAGPAERQQPGRALPATGSVAGARGADNEKVWGVHLKPDSHRPLLAELERFYAWANAVFFAGCLYARVFINVAAKGFRKATGWFIPTRWQATADPAVRPHEIVLAAEHLNHPPLEILHSLLIAMVHLSNAQVGRRDYHPLRHYYSRAFKDEAEARGLRVERDGWRGWARTILLPSTRRRIVEDFRPDAGVFAAYRPEAEPKARPKRRPWECACPVRHYVAARIEVRGWCEVCGARYVLVEPQKRTG